MSIFMPADRSGAPTADPRRPLLLHVLYSFGDGGAQTRLVRIVNHFGPSLRHIIVALNGNFGSLKRLRADADVKPLPLGAMARSLPGRLRQYGDVLSTMRPDRLVTHNWGTLEWAMANKVCLVPHIHIEDGFGPDEALRQKRRRVLMRRMLLRRSQVVVPSTGLQRAASELWKIPRQRLHYIPNGIDCERFAGCKGPDRTNRTELVIGTVAALRPEKNLKRLLAAFQMVHRQRPCRLIFVGEGPERPRLEQFARELGVAARVTFAGHTADPVPFYHALDVFVLTSDTEQMPYTILEAMAAGLPIVATNVGDIRHMVSEENQPFIVARNEQAVAGAIGQLMQDPRTAARAGEANQARARGRYTEATMFERFAELYGLGVNDRAQQAPE